MDSNIKKIFKKQLAISLIQHGNDLIRTEPNFKKKNFSVFCFKLTPKLLTDLTQLNQNNKSKRSDFINVR